MALKAQQYQILEAKATKALGTSLLIIPELPVLLLTKRHVGSGNEISLFRHDMVTAATARVIWLCACVRYWPYRGLVLSVSLAVIIVTVSDACVSFTVFSKALDPLVTKQVNNANLGVLATSTNINRPLKSVLFICEKSVR